VIAYYNILKTTMTVFFPQGISLVAEMFISIKRIQVRTHCNIIKPRDATVSVIDTCE